MSQEPPNRDEPCDELTERLANLPREAVVARDLWPGIEARMATGSWARGTLLQIAAAILIFVLGASGGFAAGTRAGPGADRSIDGALQLATEVQRTGSEYVAALAAFTSMVDSLSADARAQGRDAAVATLFGAATQLASLTGASSVPPPAGGADLGKVRF
jgi:hypothetical protein